MHDLGPDDTPEVFEASVPHRPVVVFDAVAAVFVGGAVGGMARYALAQAIPVHPGHFPWATFITNVVGCALIGALMVFVLDTPGPHRLVRPFLGVGVLGGFTTFSTFAVEADRLVSSGHAATSLIYMGASVASCLVAVAVAEWATRSIRHRSRATAGESA